MSDHELDQTRRAIIAESATSTLTEIPFGAWFTDEHLGDLRRAYEDSVQWARLMCYVKHVGQDPRIIEDLVKRLGETYAPVPERQSLRKLLQGRRQKPSYVVEDLLPESGLSVFAGGPKAGKSTTVRWFMHRITNGEPIFGRKTTIGPCLYYVLEEKFDEVLDAFRRYGASENDVHFRVGRFPPRSWLPTLRRDVADTGAVFVVADPMFDVLDVGGSNDYVEMNAALKDVVDFVRSAPVHVMFIHHTNKGEARRTTTQAFLGSRAIEGATDTNLVQEELETGRRQLFSKQRYGRRIEASYITMDEATRHLRLEEKRKVR